MEKKINRHPSVKDLREFGLVILIGFGLIGALAFYKGHAAGALLTWKISAVIGLWAIVFPKLAKPFYWTWMGLGLAIGAVTSRIVLALIFYGLFTPLAFLFRIKGRDALRLRRPHNVPSYWNDHPVIDKKSYEHLF